MRPLEDHQRFAASGEIAPLRVGARHMCQQRAMWPALGIQQERQVAGERRALVLRDQAGKAVCVHECVQFGEVFDLK
jgi:hypothetical protein